MTEGSVHPASAAPAGREKSPLRRTLDWLRHRLGLQEEETTLRDALEELIEEGEVTVDPGEKALLDNITSLRDRDVSDVMVPRAHIVAVEDSASLADLVKRLITHPHSRLPVFHDSLDDVIGMIHIKDVLPWADNRPGFSLRAILRPVLFAAPAMGVLQLLLEMRVSRLHMAMVVDEFGGVDGLVTIEDLVEAVVGDIDDEHDIQAGPDIVDRSDGTLDVRATAAIDDLEARLGAFLSEEEREDIDTVGGLVFMLAGRVPRRGERFLHPARVEFEILDADARRIKLLHVRRLSAEPDAAQNPG